MASIRKVAVIVAHPDDEVLWCGGLLLMHPHWNCFIVSLCRGKDPDRAPRYQQILSELGARGAMGDLDDNPYQFPCAKGELDALILSLLPERSYELLLTHAADGEYTRHRRHEEVSASATALLRGGTLVADSFWTFAYEDGGGTYLPRARAHASLRLTLSEKTFAEKRRLVREIYNYSDSSWETRSIPRVEAFDQPTNHDDIVPVYAPSTPPISCK